jgi:hypothetical protein
MTRSGEVVEGPLRFEVVRVKNLGQGVCLDVKKGVTDYYERG